MVWSRKKWFDPRYPLYGIGPIWDPSDSHLVPTSKHATREMSCKNDCGAYLVPYGSVFNSGGGVLHGLSARIFYVFGPGGKFGTPGPQNLARAGLGTFLEQTWEPQQTLFCGAMVYPMEITGVPLREINCMMLRRLLGRLFSQTRLKNSFT